jgi:hypothetical protein
VRIALVSLVASCNFAPPASSFFPEAPNKDATFDGGDPFAGGADAGDRPNNRAPVAHAGVDQRGFPWDTFSLDGAASLDPDGDAITYRWSIDAAPADALGGFAPFPGAASAEIAGPEFYAERAGHYVLRLEVSDGALTDSATVAIEIDPFELLPSPGGLPPADTVALAIGGGRIYSGVRPRGAELFDLGARASSSIPCELSDKINDIARPTIPRSTWDAPYFCWPFP